MGEYGVPLVNDDGIEYEEDDDERVQDNVRMVFDARGLRSGEEYDEELARERMEEDLEIELERNTPDS